MDVYYSRGMLWMANTLLYMMVPKIRILVPNSFSRCDWIVLAFLQEHPHLSRPGFTLLPCATSDWMKLLLEESNEAIQEQSLRYLSAWLSVAGQAVGLKIPLELHCNSLVPSFFFHFQFVCMVYGDSKGKFSLHTWWCRRSCILLSSDAGYTCTFEILW